MFDETKPPQPPESVTPSPAVDAGKADGGLGLGPIPLPLLLAIAAREKALKDHVRAGMAEINTQLDTLRVSMKYLIFDNECLKREMAEKDAQILELTKGNRQTVVFNLCQKLSTIKRMGKDSGAYWRTVRESMTNPALGIQAMICQERCFVDADATDCMVVIVRPGFTWKSGAKPMSSKELFNLDNWEPLNA